MVKLILTVKNIEQNVFQVREIRLYQLLSLIQNSVNAPRKCKLQALTCYILQCLQKKKKKCMTLDNNCVYAGIFFGAKSIKLFSY